MEDVQDVGNDPTGAVDDNNGSASGSSNQKQLHRQVSNISVPKVQTGILGSSSNLINSIVGAGIIGIPFAFKESGFVAGIILLIVVGIFTDKSLRMIVNLATYHPKLKGMGVLTYEDLLSIPYGRFGRYFVLISMLVISYGPMVAYLLIIKDNVPDLFGMGDSFAERELIMFVTSLVIMLPLSLLRDISQLWFTSFLSVTADLVLIIIVGIHAPIKESIQNAGGFGAILSQNWINSGLFIGLGVLSTALACQHSCFLISNTLKDHTPNRWSKVTGFSLSIATSLSLTLGIIGYLGFLSDTKGDVLRNFGQDTLVQAARALLSITMFFTYPMESFVARHVLMQLLFQGNMDNTGIDPNTGEVIPERKFLRIIGRREFWTIVLYVCALIPAFIFDDLGPVLSLTGSLGASMISYVLPGLAYIGLNGDDFLAWTGRVTYRKDHNHSGHAASGAGEVELPVAGDATATMQTTPEPTSPTGNPKPWWWWPLAMPIWVSLASQGANGCNTFFSNMGSTPQTRVEESEAEKGIIIGPRKSDYIYSVVFIIFGVVAAVAGLVSNIYVQVNGLFYSPK